MTYHTLPPEPVSGRLRLGCLALQSGRLFVPRQQDPDRAPRDGEPTRAEHFGQPGALLVFGRGGMHEQHAEADQAVAEEDGDEEDDKDQQDGELAVVYVLGYAEGEI
jgi:hypothetical protein